MNIHALHLQSIPALLSLLLVAASATAGPLNPPTGPVTPTFKTLTEVEPRIAINATNTPGDADSLFKITQPGSYYLTGNITGVAGKHGIAVAASNVTIDLRGFTLSGVSGSKDGITSAASGMTNVVIRDGTVASWGFSGINLLNFGPANCRVANVMTRGNVAQGFLVNAQITFSGCQAADNDIGIQTNAGCTLVDCSASGNTANGIMVTDGCILTRCIARSNLRTGILAASGCTLEQCAALSNAYDGISVGAGSIIVASSAISSGLSGIVTASGANLRDCVARSNATIGIDAGGGSSVTSCTTSSNFTAGIFAREGTSVVSCSVLSNAGVGINSFNECIIESCTVNDNSQDGILVPLRCVVRNNHCYGNGRSTGDGAGIHAGGGGNRIEGNSCAAADRGIDVDAPLNFISRNICEGNSTNWTVVAGNFCLVVQAAAAGAINGNTGGVAPGSADPNANFTY